MSITPGSRVGPYEVTSQLGEGGMGVVFRGHDARLQRDVALKVLPDHFSDDPDRLTRFEREAQLLASLNHSNIAQIYGLEQVEGATCIVMELVEGETLADKLKKGPLPFDETLDIARQVADALAAAHERGIIHRDLKPANIKLTPNGKVKVLDFGLAKALGTRTSEIIAQELEGGVSVSDTGLLMYRKAVAQAGRQLLWFDRNGKQVGQVGAVANYGNVDLSPKGDRAAVDILTSNNRDIWVIDFERAVPARITFGAGAEWTASWSRDGTRLAYASNQSDKNRIFMKSSTGAGSETEVPIDTDAIPVHWSPDDRYIVYARLRGNSIYETWLKPMFGEGKPVPYVESPFDKMQARISPDGNFMAYTTNETGSHQIVVQTFPDPNGGKWTISADGGTEPKWRRDGRELYYLAFDGKLMAVPISGPGFKAGRPEALFQTPLTINRAQPGRDRRYDVAPDGRFLIVTPAAAPASAPITVVVNWNAELEP